MTSPIRLYAIVLSLSSGLPLAASSRATELFLGACLGGRVQPAVEQLVDSTISHMKVDLDSLARSRKKMTSAVPPPAHHDTLSAFVWKLPVGTETSVEGGRGSTLSVRARLQYQYKADTVDVTAGVDSAGTDQTRIILSGRVASRWLAADTARADRQRVHITADLPVSVQWALLRSKATRPRAETGLALLNREGASIAIESCGRFVLAAGATRVAVVCYVVEGITWGRTYFWTDTQDRLLAVINAALPDRPQFIRAGLEPGLDSLLARSAAAGGTELNKRADSISAPHPGVLALVGGTLIDGNGGLPRPHTTILIRNGRIVAIGDQTTLRIPDGSRRIDVSGQWILPGLWDSHVHTAHAELGTAYLAAGVTTVRDMGGEEPFIRSLRDGVRRGTAFGPQMIIAGFTDGPAKMPVTGVQATSPEVARTIVRNYQRDGFDQLKVWNDVPAELLPVLIAEAHRLGMVVTGHIPSQTTLMKAVEEGQDIVDHIDFVLHDLPGDSLRDPRAIAAIAELKQRGTVVGPAVAITEFFVRSLEATLGSVEPGADSIPAELQKPLLKMGLPPAVALQA